jgi:hypothetical protein
MISKKAKTKDAKTQEKKESGAPITHLFAKLLRELHPKLPAYFCGRSGAIIPIPSGEDADQQMAELGLVRLDPDGHIDTDVLWAIYELMAEEHDDLWPSYYPQIAMKILKKALANKNSKLSQTLTKAYGKED